MAKLAPDEPARSSHFGAPAGNPAPMAGGIPRRNRTRNSLLTAAEQLLYEYPIEMLSVDQITEKAGVAKASFYNHFGDKTALLFAITASIRRDLRERSFSSTMGLTDEARLVARIWCVSLAYRWEKADRALLLVRNPFAFNVVGGRINPGITRYIRSGMQSGRFRLATAESGTLLVYGLLTASWLQAGYGDQVAWVARGQHLTAIILRGLGIPAAEADRIAAEEVDEILRPIFH